jgi:DNA-binding beta-propeller fold protein YncE
MNQGRRNGQSLIPAIAHFTGALIVGFWVSSTLTVNASPLGLAQTIALPGVEGRIDHMAIDLQTARLFVCALGNNTVEVIDLHKGERVHTISGLGTPQGVACAPELNRLFVANDQGGLCDIYDAKSFQLIGKADFQDDADNVRYDSVSKRIYVGVGHGGIGVINAMDGRRLETIKLAGHPEAFELEKHGPRIFVNVPDASHVAVINRDKPAAMTTWKTGGASANFPIALDEANRRLFIGCRTPPTLVVFNSDSGAVVASLGISGDPDDIFYDTKHHRLYAVCGTGSIEVIDQLDRDHYKTAATIPTAGGARTGLFVSELDSIFVGVPHRGSQVAEVRRYVLQ